jgi:hypothetical protein
VLLTIPEEDRASEVHLDEGNFPSVKTLGVVWQADISCNKTLALIVNGAINPKGSTNVAILFRKFRLVNLKLTSGGLVLNVNMSLSACHNTPNVFTNGKLRSMTLIKNRRQTRII